MGVVHVQGDSTKNQSFKSNFVPKAEGWYDFRIDTIESWTDPNAVKAPALILKGQVVFGDNGKHVGDSFSNFMSLDPKQAGRWRNLLDQTGVSYSVQPNQDGSEGVLFESDHLIGRHVRVLIKVNESNGKKYENWDEIAQSRYNAQVQGGGPGYVQPPQGYVQPPQGGYAPPSHVAGQGQPPPRQG